MYLILRSNGKVLSNKYCSLGMAYIRFLTRSFPMSIWSVSIWNLLPNRKWWNLPMAKATSSDSSSIATYIFGVAGDHCWQNKVGGPLIRGLHQDVSSLHQSAR